MAGTWSDDHRAFLEHEECDVWLLTEVHLETEISGMTPYRIVATMQPHKAWAAVFSRVRPQRVPIRITPPLAHVSVGSGS